MTLWKAGHKLSTVIPQKISTLRYTGQSGWFKNLRYVQVAFTNSKLLPAHYYFCLFDFGQIET